MLSNRTYGSEPIKLGNIRVPSNEMMFYLYLPIKMYNEYRIPKELEQFNTIITTAIDGISNLGLDFKYTYITAKRLWVDRYYSGNRPGWHSDGFGTDDINVIWTDTDPTIFSIQEFSLTQDHELSMKEMTNQCNPNNNRVYNANDILLLDQYVIHKVPIVEDAKIRTFIKISFSNEKYNLKGNSHNYLFNYDWTMHERQVVRNHPIYAESDFM